MDQRFDVLVIGSGSAGSSIAMQCAGAGLRTAIVDYRPYGGTCAIRGCDPKKILVGAAQYLDLKRRLPGLISKNPSLQWKDLIHFKNRFTDPVPGRRTKAYEKANITMLKGKAAFVSGNRLRIGDKEYESAKMVIATGAKPRRLHIEGEHHMAHSDHFLDLEVLPDEIIFVGGGFISFEFAHIAARFGTKVTILHNDTNPLDMFDKDMVSMLLDYSKKINIEVIFNAAAEKIEKNKSGFLVTAGNKQYSADLVVHGAGRVADIDQLHLEAAGVEHDHGVVVNAYMQSVSNTSIYCAGDAAAGSPPLTPVGSAEAKIAAQNIIGGNQKKRNFNIIPFALFTIPPLARVGISEKEAIQKSLDFRKNVSDTSSWYHAKKEGFQGTGFKFLIDKKTDKILGASLFFPEAEDTINLVTMAMQASLTVKELKEMIFTYPSITSDLKYMI